MINVCRKQYKIVKRVYLAITNASRRMGRMNWLYLIVQKVRTMCCKTMEVVCHCEINGMVGYCYFYLLLRKFIVRRRRAQQESRLDESDLREARKEMAR